MPIPPQKFREIVFQLLYSQDFRESDKDETGHMIMGELKVTRKTVAEAWERVHHIEPLLSAIDEKISLSSTSYTFDRISRVEKTILRLGLFEILHDSSIPPLVAIAEAIRLARKFGTPESAHFVNAILDKAYKAYANPTSEQQVLA